MNRRGERREGFPPRAMRRGVIPGWAGYCFAGVLCFLCLQLSLSRALGETLTRGQQEARTMERRYDTVVIKGEQLGSLQGEPVGQLRLYRFHQGRFEAVPFQVDECDPDGTFVLPSGPKPTEDTDLGLLDYNDELVFLIQDSGDRVSQDRGPGLRGLKEWVEIELKDPLALSQKAWVYLCVFSSDPPPLSDRFYIRYLPETNQIFSDHYGIGYQEGMALYTDLFYPDGKGGYGSDLLDRIKVRIKVKFFFNVIKVKKKESDFRAEVLSWKQGPVRVLRNVENYVRVLFNFSSPSVFAITEYHPHYMFTPLKVTVPIDIKKVFNSFGVSDFSWHFYGDLAGLIDGTMYTNRNLDGFPLSFAKSTGWYEKSVDTRYLVWGYGTKEGAGTWFCNLVLHDTLFQFVQYHMNIDKETENPPEDVPGEVAGGAMMNFKNVDPFLWEFISKGTYELGLETFFPPAGFQPEGVSEWRNIRQFPLLTQVVRTHPPITQASPEAARQGQVDQELCRRGAVAVMTDILGTEKVLYDINVHMGSMNCSPHNYVIGQEINTGEWYKAKFDKVKRVDNRLEARDPVTGIENPLISRITQKDGVVLDLMGCKPCTFSGYLADGRKVGYLGTKVIAVEFLEPEEACPLNE